MIRRGQSESARASDRKRLNVAEFLTTLIQT